MDQQSAHRIELLEAELRDYRQSLRILAQHVLADSEWSKDLARQAMEDVLGEES